MSVDCTTPGVVESARVPVIATIADDDMAARRLSGVLAADGLSVAAHDRHAQIGTLAQRVPSATVVVATFGAGVTERDQRMHRIRRVMPDAHLVVVMPEDSRRGVRRALEAGAGGVVFETELSKALALTVRAVLAGQVAVPAARAREVERPTLSAREKQVLRMVVDGKSNKAIAAELFLAESTVKCHLSSAFAKLGVRSRNEAADLILHSGVELRGGALAMSGANHTQGGTR